MIGAARMRPWRLLLGVTIAGLLTAGTVVADGVQPVTVQIKEQEAGSFLVQWRVPIIVPRSGIPEPIMPEHCRMVGDATVEERTAAWVNRQVFRCGAGIAGETVGVRYPFFNGTLSTLLRIQLLSGDRYAHMLTPGETEWQIPQSAAGGLVAVLREIRGAVLAGVGHFAGSGVHLAFLFALSLLGGVGLMLRLAAVFAAGQVGAVALTAITGWGLGAGQAELGAAVGVALLASQALVPTEDRRQLTLLVAITGVVHGLGISGLVSIPSSGALPATAVLLLAVLGMDAALVLAAFALSALRDLVAERMSGAVLRQVGAYAAVIVAFASAFMLPVDGANTEVRGGAGTLLLAGVAGGGTGAPASSRLASGYPNAPVQSFITVEAFETRHETLVHLAEIAELLGVEQTSVLGVEEQDEIKRRVVDLVSARTSVSIDRATSEPIGHRVDFMTVSVQGTLPRPTPVEEEVAAAWIGVPTVYVTSATPQTVTLDWSSFDMAEAIPATVTDPEASRSEVLTSERPEIRWDNELIDDPTPVVRAIAVEPVTLGIPMLSLLPLGAAMFLGIALLRRQRRGLSLAVVRISLALALILGPVANVAIALPDSFGSNVDAGEAKRILGSVLPNVYRAFEFPGEEAAYDRLAISVTGETLTDIYLEHRNAVETEERGGARARIEAVEVLEVDSVGGAIGGGFVADAEWMVGGTVIHFGHRHYRQNRYEARVAIVPVEGSWKIQSIEILDEERVR